MKCKSKSLSPGHWNVDKEDQISLENWGNLWENNKLGCKIMGCSPCLFKYILKAVTLSKVKS